MANEKNSDKKGMVWTFEKAGRFVGTVLGAIRSVNETTRDTEFLGYESFCRLNRDLRKMISPVKQAGKSGSSFRA